jgi:hypothetical protein
VTDGNLFVKAFKGHGCIGVQAELRINRVMLEARRNAFEFLCFNALSWLTDYDSEFALQSYSPKHCCKSGLLLDFL